MKFSENGNSERKSLERWITIANFLCVCLGFLIGYLADVIVEALK